jgi:hypothetical protein
MSRQYNQNDDYYDVSVRSSSRPDAGRIEGYVAVTTPGPGSRRGPSADDDRPQGRTMNLGLLYMNGSPAERRAADTLLSLRDDDGR